MHKLIARCVVDVSAKMGILGNVNDFSVAFDGSLFIPVPATMGLSYVTAAQREFTIVSVPIASLILMHDGAGIAIGYSGSLVMRFLMRLLLTALMIFPFTLRWSRQVANHCI